MDQKTFEEEYAIFCIPERDRPFWMWSTIISIIALIIFELYRNPDPSVFGIIFATVIGFSKGLLCGFILTTIKRLIQADYSDKKKGD